jgi:hypothetical protein
MVVPQTLQVTAAAGPFVVDTTVAAAPVAGNWVLRTASATLAPQFGQNSAPGRRSAPHTGHLVAVAALAGVVPAPGPPAGIAASG